jgi:hypothetical protein
MRDSSRSGWSWRFAAGLVVIAALAQACGGSSSQSSGPKGNRVELRFKEAKGLRLGALPSGCGSVDLTFQPGGTTVSAGDTTVSVLLVAGTYQVHGVLHCNGTDFQSDPPDPVFTVPPGLQSVEVALVFGGVNVDLTVQVSGGIQVTGSGIGCPGDCTERYLAGTKVKLTANNPDAVFSGGCSGQGSCEVLMNQDKTVLVGLGNQPGNVTVVNEDVGECCDADVTFTPGGIASINDLQEGDSITRTNVTPRSYTAHVEYFGGECEFSVPFTLDPGEHQVLNISADSCNLGLRKRR